MPYGDSHYRDPNSMPRSAWPEPFQRRGLRVGIASLALATMMAFVAGVGSTVIYFQSVGDVSVAALPLIEADKSPTRVRPEGLDGNGNRLMASTTASAAAPAPSSLPSPFSSAMAAATPEGVDLSPQGIPSAPEIVPPIAAAVIELPPVAASPTVSKPQAPELAETRPAGEPFRLQLATMRTIEGARQEMSRLNGLYAALEPTLELTVQRLDQGERGVFYRVLSEPVGERADAAQLCAAITERRGQCRVIGPSNATATALAAARPAASPAKSIVVAAEPVGPAPVPVSSMAAASPAAPVMAAKLAAVEASAGVRAQLGSLRSPEGAAKELVRLKGVHASALEQTELTISKIDQGDRGVFYRILTAPLPDRASASEFCKSLGPQHGCVLVGKPSA